MHILNIDSMLLSSLVNILQKKWAKFAMPTYYKPPTDKDLKKREYYRRTYNKATRAIMHVINQYERARIKYLFTAYVDLVRERMPENVYFDISKIIDVMYDQGYHLLRDINKLNFNPNIEVLYNRGIVQLFFRKKQNIIIIQDDLSIQERRSALRVYAVHFSDKQLENGEDVPCQYLLSLPHRKCYEKDALYLRRISEKIREFDNLVAVK